MKTGEQIFSVERKRFSQKSCGCSRNCMLVSDEPIEDISTCLNTKCSFVKEIHYSKTLLPEVIFKNQNEKNNQCFVCGNLINDGLFLIKYYIST